MVHLFSFKSLGKIFGNGWQLFWMVLFIQLQLFKTQFPEVKPQITGSFTTQEAKDLALVLRAGALPAPVTILENRTVGPSLGQDSIEKGVRSIIIGGVFVVFFILIYYKLSGLVANIALILNLILILGSLAYFGAALNFTGHCWNHFDGWHGYRRERFNF